MNLNSTWKMTLFHNLSPHNCLISDDPHIGIIVSWPMTLKVDFFQFEGHLSVIEGKAQNTGRGMHTIPTLFKSMECFLTKLHEIRFLLRYFLAPSIQCWTNVEVVWPFGRLCTNFIQMLCVFWVDMERGSVFPAGITVFRCWSNAGPVS